MQNCNFMYSVTIQLIFQGFTGVRDCVSRTLYNEGVLSFWRGNFASVLRYFPQQALNFAFKDQIQTVFKVRTNLDHLVVRAI